MTSDCKIIIMENNYPVSWWLLEVTWYKYSKVWGNVYCVSSLARIYYGASTIYFHCLLGLADSVVGKLKLGIIIEWRIIKYEWKFISLFLYLVPLWSIFLELFYSCILNIEKLYRLQFGSYVSAMTNLLFNYLFIHVWFHWLFKN